MDFVSDALFNGHKFRALAVVDNHTRECLAIEAAPTLTGSDVVQALTRIVGERGASPVRIQADNGPEFVSLALDKWAYEQGVTLDFSRPGKPTDNAFIESFNGSLRDECLNTHWFMSLPDARQKLENWSRITITSDHIRLSATPRQRCLRVSFLPTNLPVSPA